MNILYRLKISFGRCGMISFHDGFAFLGDTEVGGFYCSSRDGLLPVLEKDCTNCHNMGIQSPGFLQYFFCYSGFVYSFIRFNKPFQ